MNEFCEAPKNQTPERSQINIDYHTSTQPSEEHPGHNEDSFFFNPQNGSFGLFDGAGGMAGGKNSSSYCSELIKRELSLLDPKKPLNEIASELERITRVVNQSFLDSKEKLGLGGSTGIFGLICFDQNGESKIVIANIGDSRGYRAHGGVFEKITRDDNSLEYSSSEEYFRIQDHLDEAMSNNDLTKEEIPLFRSRNQISQFFGFNGQVKPKIFGCDIRPGDVLLFTSDGIHDNLTTSEIKEIVFFNKIKSSFDISQALIKAAAIRVLEKTFRSKPDDKTAMVIKIVEDSVSKPEEKTPSQHGSFKDALKRLFK